MEPHLPTGTCVVLDTSALIADPQAYDAFPGCTVVLPLTVIEELDKLKSRADEVGWLARTAIRNLEGLRTRAGGSLDAGVAVGENSTLRVEINGVQRHLLVEHGLDPDRSDNRIIGAALGLSSREPTTVVSNDAAFRLKAAHLGLTATEHQPVHRDAGPGHVLLDVAPEMIEELYATGALPTHAFADPSPNTFYALRAGSASALARVVGDELRLLPNRALTAWGLRPRNKEQRFALELLMDHDVSVVALDGPAGTGKSILAIAAALEQVVEQKRYDRVAIFRSLVPVGREEIGYLPGDLEQKTLPYFAAIYDAVTALTERGSARDGEKLVEELLDRGQLTLEPVSFLRGRSLARSFIIVDEATNLERAILKTLLTRVADGTKIVFTGDVSQIDNPFASASNNALTALIDAFVDQPCFGHVKLTVCERSEVAELAATLL